MYICRVRTEWTIQRFPKWNSAPSAHGVPFVLDSYLPEMMSSVLMKRFSLRSLSSN
ncbi:hypothetical protein AHF37_12050 [Paragonimus kellicotti]|nr:hypothetical protein AHF37_12050 [Paragonimus kellicotti]